ncbi:MAG: hypothetical protein A2284_12175 [Deltaproteobacteria bacterium RIFOXYA12_FULL_61_11]|nr:MAG: hypothetical protein A2284_12175 [Deltaproteobacteria bacterium RIFOXYA12_FULL_61_11]
MTRLLCIVLGVALCGCSTSRYVPIRDRIAPVGIPIQQDTLAQAVSRALGTLDPTLVAAVKGKTAFVEVIGGLGNVTEYVRGVVEYTLAREGVVVLPTERKQYGDTQVETFPVEASLFRVLVSVDRLGSNLYTKYSEFMGSKSNERVTYKGVCTLQVLVHELATGKTWPQKIQGESKEVIIRDGYVYEYEEG